jgi:hypothetical protein
MSDVMTHLNAKEAIDAGFKIFHDIFSDIQPKFVLLEGLEYDEKANHWHVIIGFDAGRTGLVEGMFPFSDHKTQIIRETRELTLTGDSGLLVRMSKA